MAETCQSVVDLARSPLNDDAKRRWSDADLMRHLRGAFRESYASRPDIWYPLRQTSAAAFLKPEWATYSLISNWPIDEQWIPVFADYVSARAEFVDDEKAVAQRASQFYSMFRSNLSRKG